MFEECQVFIDVDTQRDFLAPDGALHVPGSAEIVPNLARLARFARERRIPVLATACAHTPEDPELKRFPPHCLVGTPGQERIPATACPESVILGPDEHLEGDLPEHLTLQKRELDMFSHPDADRLIERLQADLPVFVVYGVATEYCVLAAVRGLLARGCKVALVVDAIRAINPAVEAEILTGLARQGVVLVTTDVICDPDRRVAIQ